MRFGQHTQRAGDQQMAALGLGAASLLDQETVGICGEGERNSRVLAGTEKLEGRVAGRAKANLARLTVWGASTRP